MINSIISRFRKSPIKSSQYLLVIGFGLLMNHKYRTACKLNSDVSDIQSPSKLYPLHIVFNRAFSYLYSKIFYLSIPQSLRWPIFKGLGTVLGVDFNELIYPLDAYDSLDMFFSRNLPQGHRPVSNHSPSVFTSPVDGRVMDFGEVAGDRVRQISVKGATYNINCFLGERVHSDKSNGKRLFYLVLRIPPGAYHHFHSPVDFKLTERRYFSGEFLPLKSLARYFSDIFTLNQRVVFKGLTECGDRVFLVAVGTFGCGRIIHDADPSFVTSRYGQIQVYLGGPIETKVFDEAISYAKGDEIGHFKQGSAIVVVFESDKGIKWNVKRGDKIKVGESLVKFNN